MRKITLLTLARFYTLPLPIPLNIHLDSAGMIIGNDLSGNWHSSIYPNVPTGTIVDDNGSLYRGSATLNPASLANGEGVTLTINVSGAALGDFVLFSAPYNLQALTVTAYVSANNVVSIRIQNDSGATVDLDAGTWKVKVIKG